MYFLTSDLFNIVWLSKQIGKDAWSQIDTVDLVLVVTTDYNGLPTSPHRIPTIRGATENIPINGNKRQSCWWYPVSKIGKSSWCKHLKIYILALALFHLVQDTPLWQKLCFLGKVLHFKVFLLSRFPPAALSSNIACSWDSLRKCLFFVTTEKVLIFSHTFSSLTGVPNDLLDVYIVNLLFCRNETTNNIPIHNIYTIQTYMLLFKQFE